MDEEPVEEAELPNRRVLARGRVVEAVERLAPKVVERCAFAAVRVRDGGGGGGGGGAGRGGSEAAREEEEEEEEESKAPDAAAPACACGTNPASWRARWAAKAPSPTLHPSTAPSLRPTSLPVHASSRCTLAPPSPSSPPSLTHSAMPSALQSMAFATMRFRRATVMVGARRCGRRSWYVCCWCCTWRVMQGSLPGAAAAA